jgi:hypothetical protein
VIIWRNRFIRFSQLRNFYFCAAYTTVINAIAKIKAGKYDTP